MKYIAICGTVGSGKTTLLERLIERLGSRAAWHEERPQDNPFITDYYADTQRWTFHAQISFLSLYFDKPRWREETAELFFFDRCFLENLVIARYRRDQGDLTEDEYQTICQLANGVSALMPEIDKYIYLDCSIGTVLEHIRGRGRAYEDDLDLMYVYDLKALYDEWAKTLPPERTLVVHMDDGEYDLDEIIRFIEE